MIILIVNCGSSSLKYQLLDMKSDDAFALMAKGSIERIGMDNAHLKHVPSGKEIYDTVSPIADHTQAMKLVLAALTDKEHGVLETLSDINAVGHRVLHGGDVLFKSSLIDEAVIAQIEKCCDLGPLHNPANLMGIKAATANLPGVPQVAVFDTAFHQTMPAHNYIYGIPYEYYEKYRIRKYGFHGTSHKFVSRRAIKFAGLDPNNCKIITCHLGNGSSISAVQNGKCVDTSMGLTPLDGVLMGTRCGSIDPEVVCYLMNKEGFTPKQMSDLMNKKSGLLGISGCVSDLRDCQEVAAKGNERAQLALEKLSHDVIKTIGACAAEMNGVDLIVFTGGIGENNTDMRAMICKNLGFLGAEFDPSKSKIRGEECFLTTPGSKLKVAVIPTNEELMIAHDTMEIVNAL